jgi:hypothetical protein
MDGIQKRRYYHEIVFELKEDVLIFQEHQGHYSLQEGEYQY